MRSRFVVFGSVIVALATCPGAWASAGPVAGKPAQPVVPRGAAPVLVHAYVSGAAQDAAESLRAAGMRVRAVTNLGPVPEVEGVIAPSDIPGALKIPGVRAIVPALGDDTDAGAVVSQGDVAHRGPQARVLGVNGSGVSVGIISDSIGRLSGASTLATSKANGDLPANTQVLTEGPVGATDEGRAMAEVVYDEAPGISGIVFSSGSGCGAAKVAAINQLVAAGVKVIADDVACLEQPFFQEGAIAQAVNNAKAAGVAYFASAGDSARQSYEAAFASAGNTCPASIYTAGETGPCHDFGGGVVAHPVAVVPAGATLSVSLQWNESFAAAVSDIDLFLVNHAVGNALLAFSAGVQNGTQPPREIATYKNNTAAPVSVDMSIVRFAGTATPLMKTIVSGGAPVQDGFDTINPDAASALGSLAVAAVDFGQPGLNIAEPFSSRGPHTLRRNGSGAPIAPIVQAKPSLAGADGVSTDLPAGSLNPFAGTSAATAHAAGVAALVRSAAPALSVDQVYAIMTNPANAIPCLAGADDCGVGFVQADRAVREALPRADVSLAAAAAPAATLIGGQSTVVLTASNAGPNPVSLTVAAPVPVGTELVSASPAQGTYNAATGLWSVGTVAPGAGTALVLTLKTATAGSHTLVAEVAAASLPDPDSTPGSGGAAEDDYATATITTAAPAGAPPVLDRLAVKPSKFGRPGGATPKPGAKRIVRSAKLSVRLSKAATVTGSVDLARPGRTAGKRCVAATKGNRSAKRCTRYTRRAALTFRAAAGTTARTFTAKIGKTILAPGTYRLTASAKDAAGIASKRGATTTFTVLAG